MIYLCRHGETEFNLVLRRQGQRDSDLTALGRAQACAMGRKLARLVGADFRIFASPLGRAQHSARLIAAELGGADITLDARLMEIGMGSWDGKTDAEIDAAHPGLRARFHPQALWFESPDGESYDVFAKRLQAAMTEISADAAAVKIVVAHGVAGRVIRAGFAGMSRAASYDLPAPQDGFFGLHPTGKIEFIAT